MTSVEKTFLDLYLNDLFKFKEDIRDAINKISAEADELCHLDEEDLESVDFDAINSYIETQVSVADRVLDKVEATITQLTTIIREL